MGERRWEIGVLGATGLVGQQVLSFLEDHPWFTPTWLAASERSRGRRYGEVAWRLPAAMPRAVRDLPVEAPVPGRGPRLVFSALDAAAADTIEPAFAAAGHVVVSNARSHRLDPVVPLLIPEVNADHLALLTPQRQTRGWEGAIVTNPNCSTIFLAMVLAALRGLRPRTAVVTTLQAVSGAGYPGVASLDMVGNVVPGIPGEEEKIETETAKILGRLNGAGIEPAAIRISAHTTRVPVANGHTEMISLAFETPPSLDEVRAALGRFAGRPQHERLPSAPCHPLVYLDDPLRPQPRLDVDRGDGMTVSVGRLRPCPVFDWKLVALGHNTVRGAAGAAVLNAELMAADGLLD
jgi:aspartate-semialdehyde dehydrogenase